MNGDFFLFGLIPYIVVTVAIVGTIYRYVANRYTWSSLSSEFLENKVLFFGSFPWHFGIILVLFMHIFAIIFPSAIIAWNGVPLRLYLLEITGAALGILALFGLIMFLYRRLTDSRVRAVTSTMDIIVLIVLIVQVVTGLINALVFNWGSNWYAGVAVPYLRSLLAFGPDVSYVANLPLATKIHIFNAWIFIFLIPFSRFVHFLAFINPLKYLGRRYQLVRWYGRDARTENIRQYK